MCERERALMKKKYGWDYVHERQCGVSVAILAQLQEQRSNDEM